MKRFGGKTSSWLLRQAEYLGENSVDQAVWEVEAIISEGRELVLHSFEVVNASFQALPPKDAPICFARAVIGLGSQCGLNYCANSIPTEVYQEYSRRIKEYYWPNPERWRLHMILRAEQERIRGDQEQHHLDRSLVFSPTKCIHSAQYYNFDPEFSTTPRSEEPQERQARGQPDDAQTDPRKRSLPIVAILKREGTRSVINLDRVISVIAETGHFRLKVISYDHGCGIPETAYLMRDVQILISPHGNALGSSLWMPSTEPSNSSLSYFPTVISIDSTKYTESWFQWTTTSMGQRFMVHRCGPAHSTHPFKSEMNPAVCPFHRDMDLARRTLSKAGLVLNPEKKDDDLLELTGEEFPIDLWEKYGGENVNKFLNEYWKSLSRYADPDRLLEILYKIREYNLPRQEIDEGVSEKKMSFLQLCRESKCCAPSCSGVMHRNVVGPLRAYDQDLSEDNWGRLRDNEEHDAFVMSGLALMDWFPSLT
ncbi:hypothetical protein EMPS_02401 [Entomortierella parvispora]|uniref:Glycosyltransferase 61 catalytic domain-containing protein n=1 Tax=Entomortierella parvispora TaxID=205924 RepID=A0A9P3H5D5_9FUNG|nr:hypothetical protein EMPS_02401 [Entomortierella parvispora]